MDFSEYRLTDLVRIAETNMSVVYEATQQGTERRVCLKVMAPGQSGDAVRRFQREAQILTSLSHTNIANVFQFGVAEQRPFIVMELLKGEDLAARLKRGPLSLGEAAAIFLPICDALYAAHQAGIIHRDLKPSNIFLEGGVTPKLIDFGIAKLEAEQGGDGKLTSTGVLIGSPQYMSPEQCAGKTVDERCDLYALACVIAEALSGQRVFAGDSDLEIMYKHMNNDADLSGLPGISPAMAACLTRCLRKEPQQRFGSAAELRPILEEALGKPASTSRSLDRKPLVILAGILVLGLALALTYLQSKHQSSTELLTEKKTKLVLTDKGFAMLMARKGTFDIDGDGASMSSYLDDIFANYKVRPVHWPYLRLIQLEVLMARWKQAAAQGDQKSMADIEKEGDHVVAEIEKLLASNIGFHHMVICDLNLAKWQGIRNNAKEANRLFLSAIRRHEGRQATFVEYYEDDVRVNGEYGIYLDEQGHHKEAEPIWRHTIALAKQYLGPDNARTKIAEVHLALNLARQDSPDKRKEADTLVESIMSDLGDSAVQKETETFHKELAIRHYKELLQRLKSYKRVVGDKSHDDDFDKRTNEILTQRRKLLQDADKRQ